MSSVFCVFFYFGFFTRQVDKVKGMYLIYKGDKAYKEKRLVDAIRLYQNGLRLYPNHKTAANNLGNIYVAYEDYSSAVDAYNLALKYNPDFILCRINLAIVLSSKFNDYESAIQEYEKVVRSNPFLLKIPFIYNNKESVKLNKGCAYYNMGLAYRALALLSFDSEFQNKQFLHKAKESYEKGLKFLQNDYNLNYNLALMNHMLDYEKEAGKYYCKAISIEPLNYEAHYNLAVLFRSMRHYREAYKELEKATLIVDVSGDANKSRYIFDVLNEVSQRIVRSGDYKYFVEHLDKDEYQEGQITYIKGKVVISEQLDKAIYDNMKKCEGEKFFK